MKENGRGGGSGSKHMLFCLQNNQCDQTMVFLSNIGQLSKPRYFVTDHNKNKQQGKKKKERFLQFFGNFFEK